jgi:hypothetical protein
MAQNTWPVTASRYPSVLITVRYLVREARTTLGGAFSKASDLGLLPTSGGAITPLDGKNHTETERR